MLDFLETLLGLGNWSSKGDRVPRPLRIGMNLFLIGMVGIAVVSALIWLLN